VTWLLDTNIVSELRKGERADPRLRAWFAEAEEDALFTSVLVVGEVRRGIESIRRRDVPSALALELWLTTLTDGFADRILPVDRMVPTVDGLLAATARVHGLTLVTRNTRDVTRTGVPMLDPTA
jgi:toxin FitB